MIVWINGAFGSGKTQTAHELQRRVPGSYLYDPENVGYFLRKNMPRSLQTDDFQDDPLWREFNYKMLSSIAVRHSGAVIVPMTIVNRTYFEEIVGRLRTDGETVRHFALCASRETLLKRLRSRGEGGRSWAARQIDRCAEGLAHEAFRCHLDTEGRTIEQVAERIAAMAGLELAPDTRHGWKKRLDRLGTQIRHIRFFQ
ncbi:AAA family ATPase [Cohnella algarum]|uniref:AAA family ATPase n=1 Tax=Cohnella algarum TaxID=2044859 RepID=UPI0019680FC8|nr:AAA family ATPase [Cohnella algarum]MBN2984163.1 AAA family ATPase [Cohnella algarum]